jgi:hypothetical protein
MNTWDVARAITKKVAVSSTSLSTAAPGLLLSYTSSSLSSPSSAASKEQSKQQVVSIDHNFRDSVINLSTETVRVVICTSNCDCNGFCKESSEEANDIEIKNNDIEIIGGMEVDNSEFSGQDKTSPQEGYGMIEVEAEQLLFGYGAMSAFESTFNGSFNDTLYWNSSLYNDTYILEGLYPSGYGLPHIIVASIVVTLLMIVIVIGNMLVIIAIATEKALKNIQNWFIASLAVADFFLGLLIMPFSLANEIMGYWIFGYWWCDIHSAMDVLLCTASIMNLCLISLDRFWSITQAVEYLKKRTPARAALMIAMVWVLSAVICIPPLLGWKRSAPEEEYPKCKVSNDINPLYHFFLSILINLIPISKFFYISKKIIFFNLIF